jgi:2-methylcitrate dehydratase PrpD
MALGFAGTQAAGLNTFFTSGDFTKSLHPGKAAFNGILSARLAALDATSPPTMLEHEKGYINAFSLEPNAEALTRGLGSDWEILQNGFKFFPSILASHGAIQATLAAVGDNDIKAGDIASLTLETYSTVKSHFSSKDVSTQMGARVSVPYCMAIAAIDRAVGQRQFAADRIDDPAVRTLLANTEVVADAELTKLYPAKFPARVTITLKNGRRVQAYRDFPKGDPQDPLTPAEIEGKFLDNVSARHQGRDGKEIVRLIRVLPSLDDLTPLFALLGR